MTERTPRHSRVPATSPAAHSSPPINIPLETPLLPFTRAALLLALLTSCFGCGAGNFGSTTSPATSATAPRPSTTSSYYHAYGDSITFGYGLATPATSAYPYLLSIAESVAVTDYARSGDQACDIPTLQIFPNADSPSTATPALYTVLISTNDADVKGVGPYEAVFNLCHQATLAWLGTPSQAKTLASAATTSGPTHIDNLSHFNSVTTDALNASLTFTVSLAAPGPVYLWYRIVDGSPGAFSYMLDGTLLGSLATGTTPSISTQNGGTTSLALLRIPAVPRGRHTFTLIQTTPGLAGAGFVAIAVPPTTRPAGSPRVLVGTTPLQLAGGSPCGVEPSLCLAYVADITANVSLLAADGLDVELFDSRKYMTGTPADMLDSVHPNLLGHQEILHAITDIF